MVRKLTPDRRRWQFGIASLLVLQALTCIVMSVYTTFGLGTIVAIALFTFPLGMIVLGTVLVAGNMQKVSDWYAKLGRWSLLLYAVPVGLFLLIVFVVSLFFK